MDVPALWKDTNIFYNILCFLITENEKLFDRNDAKLYWSTVFHVISLSHHVYISQFANNIDFSTHTHPEIQKLCKFRTAYLTGWNFAFQTIFLLLSLTHDSLQWLSKEQSSLAKRIGHWRDVVFNALVVPFTLFVSIMFWCLYTIDRELVFPQVYDDIVPWWFNHCVHTNIAIVVAVETLLTARRQPASRKVELVLNSVVAFGYAIVYYTIYYFTGRWLYNIFGIMTWWQVCLYQLLIWSSTYLFYFIHFPINRIFHGKNEEDLIEEKTEPVEGFDNPVKSDSFAAEVWSQNVYIRDSVENSRL